MKTQKRKTIELNLGVIVVVIAVTVIGIMMLKYHVEGEKDLPYTLKQMVIISTANGANEPLNDYKWNIKVHQNTDIYFEIAKNAEYKSNENLKNVKIQDIQIDSNEKYEPQVYIPSKQGEEVFNYTEENKARQEIEYTVDKAKNTKERKLTTEGGIVALSVCIPNIGTYQGNDDKIAYDGTLLNKMEITKEDITCELKFSLIMETESGKSYKAEISLTLPQEDITESGMSKTIDEDLTDIVFKRAN